MGPAARLCWRGNQRHRHGRCIRLHDGKTHGHVHRTGNLFCRTQQGGVSRHVHDLQRTAGGGAAEGGDSGAEDRRHEQGGMGHEHGSESGL